MDLPQRKKVRMNGYDYSQNGGYFITICTKNHAQILGKIVGGDAHIAPQSTQSAAWDNTPDAPYTKLSQYGMIVEKYINGIMGIDKYVIMPNHIHMIILINSPENGTMWASSPTIPQLIKSFKILVTKEIHLAIFQRSYHDRMIRNEQEYFKIWEYIHTNPSRWQDDCFYAPPAP